MEVSRPRLLDLFCGAGGCSMGYHRAGFDVVGVDIKPQPRYPFPFLQADCIDILNTFIWNPQDGIYANDGIGHVVDCFAVIHASPPCQAYSAAKRIGNSRPGHKDLIDEVRSRLEEIKKPWVIENVPGSPLRSHVELCGTQFGLPLRRHRFFESSEFLFTHPNPCRHRDGDKTVFGHVVQTCGSRGKAYKDAKGRTHWRPLRVGIKDGYEAMGIDWMNRGELSEAIPPAYTEYIGNQLIRILK